MVIRNRSRHFSLRRKDFNKKKNLSSFQIKTIETNEAIFRKNRTYLSLKTIPKINSRQFEKIISNIDGHS